jgi:hypothetical protein
MDVMTLYGRFIPECSTSIIDGHVILLTSHGRHSDDDG